VSFGLILPFQNRIVSPHVPNLLIVNTSRASDQAPHGKFPFKLQPDCSVYATENKTKDDLDLSRVDFFIEMKSEADPFVINVPSNSRDHTDDDDRFYPFVRSGGRPRANLGQITAYAMAILSTQYRTHAFSAFIVKDYARLIRWDRGGAVVTEPIYYDKEPHLLDFLIRYDLADRAVRGHDTTVGLPTQGEIELAKAIVPELNGAESFLAVTISGQDQQPSSRRYIISGPECRADVPVGRWTRSSFALDANERRRVLLKDSWRVLLKDIEPEGEIYRRLHENGVCNIPSCLSAGDVGPDVHHRSRTHEFTRDVIGNGTRYKLTPHRHYRIVLGTIGRRLGEFRSTHELVNAMYAALKGETIIFFAVCVGNLTPVVAHEAAYRVGILHRDISPGNMLIASDDELDRTDPYESKIEGGLLIDWDLSRIVDPDDKHGAARQYTRTVSRSHDSIFSNL